MADDEPCQKILDASNPFECFGLPTGRIEPAAVRNLYLKIAVKVHPDKNKSSLATQAFQVLSESFEKLHDEERQHTLLASLGGKKKHRRRGKQKERDAADLVQQTSNWYSKDWEGVEAEIARMTNEFKEHLARGEQRQEAARERRAEKRERRNKRIKRNLDYLREKYGLSPSESESDNERRIGYGQEEEKRKVAEEVQEKKQEEEKSGQAICWLCQRSFKSHKQLQLHNEQSQLHKDNLAKREQAQPEPAAAAPTPAASKGVFKSTFSAVPSKPP